MTNVFEYEKSIVIIGTGGLAREVKWLIDECNKTKKRWNVLGWISKEKPGVLIEELPVLGDDEWLKKHKEPIEAAVGIGDGKLRKKIVSTFKDNKNISFPSIVSPSAELSDSVLLGEGTIITAKCVLTVDIKIGDFFFCNLASTVGHDCIFSDYVTLNPGVNVSGNVNLGECVTIGTGASIIQGLSIGNNAMIGAGAVVISDIGDNCTAVGVPAKVIKEKHFD